MDFVELPDARNTIGPIAQPEYARDGHLDSVTVIAEFAGLDTDTSKSYGIYSQIPDYMLWSYSSGTPVWAWITGWEKEAKLLSEFLHAFHGGGSSAVLARRRFLGESIRDLVRSNALAWKIGFLTHAFGDAYAHVRPVDGEITAYEYPLGHALSPHDPDNISKHPTRYLAYCTALVTALGGSETAPRFRDFHNGLAELFDELQILEEPMWKRKKVFRAYLKAQSSTRVTNDELDAAGQKLVFDEVIAFLTEKQSEAGR